MISGENRSLLIRLNSINIISDILRRSSKEPKLAYMRNILSLLSKKTETG